MSQFRPTVAIDFDGVIHSYTSGWTGQVPIDPPRPGALAFINDLMAEGYNVVCHTARANNPMGQLYVRSYLKLNGFPEMAVTGVKPAAIAYVDDRAVYMGPESRWSSAFSAIEKLNVRLAPTLKEGL